MAMGSKTNATNEPAILGVQVTTSLYNTAIPLLIGKRRCAGEVIWYGYFGPSSGSSKKGKSGKKGITNYQANLDLLIGYGPIWNIQSTWNNSYLYAYSASMSPPFAHAYTQTFTITDSATFTSTIPTDIDFVNAISFTPTTPVSVTVNDYGDPQGSHTITEIGLATAWSSSTAYTLGQIVSYSGSNWACTAANTNVEPTTGFGYWQAAPNESEQWLYNIYNNYTGTGTVGNVAWRPGNWEFGATYCNNASCTFPMGYDHTMGGTITCTFPQPVTGTITVYYGATDSGHDDPLTFIKYYFEASLGEGTQFNGSLSSQQVIYPELSGCGGSQIDLGASGTAPELDVEAEGLYALTASGQANAADVILDLILSGNIFFGSGRSIDSFTPLCFSHGLNFGGDPTRSNANSDGIGTLTWPPAVSFPWVLPMGVLTGLGNSSGSQFQILRDPPTFNQGVYSGSTIYNVNSIVTGSDGDYYKALTSGQSDPVSGGTAEWMQFTGNPYANTSPLANAPFSDGLTDVRNYCHANSIYVSLFLKSQQACSDILDAVCQIANCVPVWNGQTLDFYPLSEVSAVGGGYQYTPRTTAGPILALDYNYFVTGDKDTPPVTIKQENMQSVGNILDINYADASFDNFGMCGYSSYASNSVRICDAEHCQLYGPMNLSPLGFDDYICDATTATNVGWPILNRQRFMDPYTVSFDLPATVASLLDPMDLVTVVDPLFGGTTNLGIPTSGIGQQDVRISDLEEDKDGTWTLNCERFMFGVSAPEAPKTTGSNSSIPSQLNALAGSVNTPYFFEPTAALAVALGMGADGGICVAVSGTNAAYGGYVVNVSTDGGSSYNSIGRIVGNPDMGVTYNSDYPSHVSPDNSDTLYVDLTESLGELDSFTSGQQTQLIPVALIDNSGAPGTGSAAGYTTTIPYEIISYQSTTLTATNKYSAAPPILRGQLGSVPADHPIGSVFVDLSTSTSIFKYAIPSGTIVGNVLYFKFQAFNQFGSGVQDISDCTAYTFTLTGQTNPTSPTSPAAGGTYTVNPSPCLYQGKSGGWLGIDGSSTSWTNPDYVYFPPLTVNYGSGAVNYSANDSGTTAFTGSGQTVYVCINDPSHAGGTPTVDVQSTNEHATTPGYVYLGSITSAAAGSSGGTSGSGGSGGPQDGGTTGTAAGSGGDIQFNSGTGQFAASAATLDADGNLASVESITLAASSSRTIAPANGDAGGVLVITAGNTAVSYSFASNYIGVNAPVVIVTPTSDPLVGGVVQGYYVAFSGSSGAWTGFTINIQAALASNITFGYAVLGQT
jgi:hypothetical protein